MVLTAPSPTSRRLVALLLLVVVALFGASRAAAGDTEVRDFITQIDRKPAGTYRMRISTDNQGNVTMTGSAKISFTVFRVRTFTYTYEGTEVWKDGRLTSFDSKTNDDGKKYTVSAKAEREGLRKTVNDQERMIRPDVWLTTYWRLPDPKLRGQAIALLDADTGRDLTGTLQLIDVNELTIAGQRVNCNHYQITGDVQVDFWYDGSDRLVRQEWVENGYRVVLYLASLSRP
jgi:hypothetical protein